MDEHREQYLRELRDQIRDGRYRVEPTAVADALVHRVWGFDVDPALAPVPLAAAPSRVRRHARLGAVTGGVARRPHALAALRG